MHERWQQHLDRFPVRLLIGSAIAWVAIAFTGVLGHASRERDRSALGGCSVGDVAPRLDQPGDEGLRAMEAAGDRDFNLRLSCRTCADAGTSFASDSWKNNHQ